jgi:hypothetical protein
MCVRHIIVKDNLQLIAALALEVPVDPALNYALRTATREH